MNPRDEYSQNGDGQNIACNFLNAGDMIAYADWTGLRPLTELEFEKMSRRPYPYPALRGEYVWNTAENFTPAAGFFGETEGKSTERLASGNINAEAKLKGPVRSGAFAAGGAGQTEAGASFWGVMDLGGNLAELYYNSNTEGRAFCGLQDANHGDGKSMRQELGMFPMFSGRWNPRLLHFGEVVSGMPGREPGFQTGKSISVYLER